MKRLYGDLFNHLTLNSLDGIALKTDLFDEAIGPDSVYPLLRDKCRIVSGIDISHEIVKTARNQIKGERKYPKNFAQADVRKLAFKSNSIDLVFSNSTLDHFNQKQEIYKSLKEIHRVLKPDGMLLITLDNLHNPAIFLRNLLPSRPMVSAGIIPYQMGATLTVSELANFLKLTGFDVRDKTAIVHSPRFAAIRLGTILQRIGNNTLISFYLELLRMFEHLQKLPSRYFTGYFIVVKATKKKSALEHVAR